jgi:hypothetical protein
MDRCGTSMLQVKHTLAACRRDAANGIAGLTVSSAPVLARTYTDAVDGTIDAVRMDLTLDGVRGYCQAEPYGSSLFPRVPRQAASTEATGP